MELLHYERPREKLQLHGASYLTVVELLQLIIGSGSTTVSAAKLSRYVQALIEKDAVTYTSLVSLVGIGSAKACQIIAAIELGSRVRAMAQNTANSNIDIPKKYFDPYLAKGEMRVIFCNGSKQYIDMRQYVLGSNEHHTVIVKKVFTDAIINSARCIYILIHARNPDDAPSTSTLSMLQYCYNTATISGVFILGIHGVYKDKTSNWSNLL